MKMKMTKKVFLWLLFFLLIPLELDASRLFVASNSDKIVILGPPLWTAQISASMWVYPVSLPTIPSVFMGIIDDNGTTSTTYRFVYGLINSAGTQQVLFGYNSSTGGTPLLTCNATLSTGQWSHLAFAFDNTTNPDTLFIWINGASQTTTAPGNNGAPSGSDGGAPRIGNVRFNGVETFFFDGRIAEPALWIDVPILNQQQVTALSRGARADRVYIQPDLYYPVDGVFDPEPDYGKFHGKSVSITGTSRANGPPVVPR